MHVMLTHRTGEIRLLSEQVHGAMNQKYLVKQFEVLHISQDLDSL